MNASSHFDMADILSKRCNSIIDDGLSTQINAWYTLNEPRMEWTKNKRRKKIWITQRQQSVKQKESKKIWRLARTVCIFFRQAYGGLFVSSVCCVCVLFSLFSVVFVFPSGSHFMGFYCCTPTANYFFITAASFWLYHFSFAFGPSSFLCCDQWLTAPISDGFITNTHTKQQQHCFFVRFVTKETNKVLVKYYFVVDILPPTPPSSCCWRCHSHRTGRNKYFTFS